MNGREIIANRLMKAGWNLGWISSRDSEGRAIWIVDAHRDDGKRQNFSAVDLADGPWQEQIFAIRDKVGFNNAASYGARKPHRRDF